MAGAPRFVALTVPVFGGSCAVAGGVVAFYVVPLVVGEGQNVSVRFGVVANATVELEGVEKGKRLFGCNVVFVRRDVVVGVGHRWCGVGDCVASGDVCGPLRRRPKLERRCCKVQSRFVEKCFHVSVVLGPRGQDRVANLCNLISGGVWYA